MPDTLFLKHRTAALLPRSSSLTEKISGTLTRLNRKREKKKKKKRKRFSHEKISQF